MKSLLTPARARPPRADAERNARALLAATREFVLAGELNPSAAQIAEAAGVGVGTLYRRALGKEALLAASVIDLLDKVREGAADPETARTWEAFERFAMEYLRIRDVACTLTHSLEDALDGGVPAAKKRMRAAFEMLAGRLHSAGLLDPDVDAADLMVLLASIDVIDDTLGLVPDRGRRDRVVRRLLASLRVM